MKRIEENGGTFHKYDLTYSNFIGKNGYQKLAYRPSIIQHTGAWSGTHPNFGEMARGFQSKLNPDQFRALIMIAAAVSLNLEIDLNCGTFAHPRSAKDYVLLNLDSIQDC